MCIGASKGHVVAMQPQYLGVLLQHDLRTDYVDQSKWLCSSLVASLRLFSDREMYWLMWGWKSTHIHLPVISIT